MQQIIANGVNCLVERTRMSPSVLKLRDAYARVPGAPLFKREFGFYCLERWKEQGMPQDVPKEVSYKNYLHYRKRCIELGG